MKLRAAVSFDQFAGQNEFLWARLRKGVARPELVELPDELILCLQHHLVLEISGF